MSKEQTR